MSSTKFWALAGLVVLVGAAAWSARTPAQPFPRPDMPGMPGMSGPMGIGRFTAVKSDGTTIIILDTVTGDLYKATEKDLKEYKSRPKMGMPSFPKFPTFPKDFDPSKFPGFPKDFKFPTPPKDAKIPKDFSKFFPKDFGKKDTKPAPETPEKKEE